MKYLVNIHIKKKMNDMKVKDNGKYLILIKNQIEKYLDVMLKQEILILMHLQMVIMDMDIG